MHYDIHETETTERTLMAVPDEARFGELPATIRSGFDKVWPYLRAQGAKTGHNVVVYRKYDRGAGVMTIDVGVQVDAPLAGDGTVVPVTTPGGKVATTVHIGPYEKLGAASSALLEYCKARGYRIGPTWEEYGDWTDDPTKLRTNVYQAIE
jgi:effector-binding domain-containing protein